MKERTERRRIRMDRRSEHRYRQMYSFPARPHEREGNCFMNSFHMLIFLLSTGYGNHTFEDLDVVTKRNGVFQSLERPYISSKFPAKSYNVSYQQSSSFTPPRREISQSQAYIITEQILQCVVSVLGTRRTVFKRMFIELAYDIFKGKATVGRTVKLPTKTKISIDLAKITSPEDLCVVVLHELIHVFTRYVQDNHGPYFYTTGLAMTTFILHERPCSEYIDYDIFQRCSVSKYRG